MKNAPWLAACCILSGCGIAAAQTPGAPAKTAPVPSAANPTTGGAIASPSDPLQRPVAPPPSNFVPTAIADPADIPTTDPEVIAAQTIAAARAREQNENSEDEIAAEAEQQKQAEEQHDWMLRDYQERLRKQGLVKGPAADSDPDGSQPAKTPDGTAGDSTIDPASDPLLESVLAVDQPSTKRASQIANAEPSDLGQRTVSGSSLSGFLQPLLPPLISATNPSGPSHDFFGGPSDSAQAAATGQPDNSDTPAPSGEDAVLDVPGMTAAQQGGLIDPSLSLDDRLPDETGTAPAAHQNENDDKLPTAPLNDIAAYYKKQAADLAPPTAPGLQAPPVVLTLPKTYQPPPQTARPALDGLRNHVADPFDFLNR